MAGAGAQAIQVAPSGAARPAELRVCPAALAEPVAPRAAAGAACPSGPAAAAAADSENLPASEQPAAVVKPELAGTCDTAAAATTAAAAAADVAAADATSAGAAAAAACVVADSGGATAAEAAAAGSGRWVGVLPAGAWRQLAWEAYGGARSGETQVERLQGMESCRRQMADCWPVWGLLLTEHQWKPWTCLQAACLRRLVAGVGVGLQPCVDGSQVLPLVQELRLEVTPVAGDAGHVCPHCHLLWETVVALPRAWQTYGLPCCGAHYGQEHSLVCVAMASHCGGGDLHLCWFGLCLG